VKEVHHVSGDFFSCCDDAERVVVINEVGKGRDKWSNMWLVLFLFSLSASAAGLVRAVMLMG